MTDLLLALSITIVEFLILWLFFRKSPFKLFVYSVIINSFTLPAATFIYIYVLNNILIIEIAVVLVESVLIIVLMEIKYKKALFISTIANLTAVLIGFSSLI